MAAEEGEVAVAPCGAPERLRGRAAAPHHGGHPALRGEGRAPIGAARQEDSLLDRCSWAACSTRREPQSASTSSWSLRGPTTTRCATSTSTALATCATASSQASRRSECPRCPSVASALSVHLQAPQRHDDGCVHPPDSLSAGDALWHRSLSA